MKHSRRDLSLLLPSLAAMAAAGQNSPMPSRTFRFEDLPVRVNGRNRSRAVLSGATRNGYAIEMHQTELAPGMAPHPPHHHVHEELLLVREGTMEVTVRDKTTTLGPGSAAYVASGEEHGWRNVGTTQAHYFVVTLGRESR